MSVIEKEISGSKYTYFQYRDRDGNHSIYLGSPQDSETKLKAGALRGAYQIALIEDRYKKWVLKREVQLPLRLDWLERSKDAAVTDKDRLNAIVLAEGILEKFHKDICRHADKETASRCSVYRAYRSLQLSAGGIDL